MRRLRHRNVIQLVDVLYNEEKQKMYPAGGGEVGMSPQVCVHMGSLLDLPLSSWAATPRAQV